MFLNFLPHFSLIFLIDIILVNKNIILNKNPCIYLLQVQLAYSKIWKHRQEAMETVYSEITTEPTKLTVESDPRMIVKATALLLKRMLSDNVYTVISSNGF